MTFYRRSKHTFHPVVEYSPTRDFTNLFVQDFYEDFGRESLVLLQSCYDSQNNFQLCLQITRDCNKSVDTNYVIIAHFFVEFNCSKDSK